VLAVGGLREKVLAAHYAHIHHLVIPAENEKDLAEIPAKIRQSIHFTFVDNVDQVIETALLDAPPPEERQDELEHTPTTPRPLQLDERTLILRDATSRRTVIPADEKGEEKDDDEHQPLIIPPSDRITGDSYPQIHAQGNKRTRAAGGGEKSGT